MFIYGCNTNPNYERNLATAKKLFELQLIQRNQNNEETKKPAHHILCLGRTIYEIKNKEDFFESCHSLFNSNGYLVLNLS